MDEYRHGTGARMSFHDHLVSLLVGRNEPQAGRLADWPDVERTGARTLDPFDTDTISS